jgi:hypothetical protein
MPLWWLFMACRVPSTEAPATMEESLRQTFRAFEFPPEEWAAALATIDAEARSVDLSSNQSQDRAFLLAPLVETDVADIARPDRPLEDAMGVAVARRSGFAVSAHAALQTMADQTAIEPSSPEYERTLLEGEECWATSCDLLRSGNDIVKKNLLMEVDYTLYKDFRSVEVDAGEVMVARSWTTDPAYGDGGDILQNYTVEVWLPDGEGSLRLLSLWSESEIRTISASDETKLAFTMIGIDDTLRAADEWLEALQ